MSDLLPCPLCGASKGYELAKGDTSRWWIAVCAGCGDFVCECRSDRSTGYNAELPTHWGPADLEWNCAAKHAHELRTQLDSANAEIERLRAELDATKKDAARYQFIRAGNAYIEPHDEHEIYVAIEAGKYYTDLRDLDMDIDEAIAAAPKPEE